MSLLLITRMSSALAVDLVEIFYFQTQMTMNTTVALKYGSTFLLTQPENEITLKYDRHQHGGTRGTEMFFFIRT